MKLFFIIFPVFFVWCSCSDKDKVPKGVLPKQQMQEIMWDMTRAGEFLNVYVLSKDSTVDKIAESQKWYDKIYQLHKTNKAEFDKSYAYYKARPLVMKEILDSLGKRQVSGRPVLHSVDESKRRALQKDTSQLNDTMRKRMDSLLKKRIIKKKKLVNPV